MPRQWRPLQWHIFCIHRGRRILPTQNPNEWLLEKRESANVIRHILVKRFVTTHNGAIADLYGLKDMEKCLCSLSRKDEAVATVGCIVDIEG